MFINKNKLNYIEEKIDSNYTKIDKMLCNKFNNIELKLEDIRLESIVEINNLYSKLILIGDEKKKLMNVVIDNVVEEVNSFTTEKLTELKNDVSIKVNELDEFIRKNIPLTHSDCIAVKILEKVDFMCNKINEFYYENERFKHQLYIEEMIRGCNDEILQIKTLIDNLKEQIDTTINENVYLLDDK